MKKLGKILLWIVLLFFGSTILIVLLYRFMPVYYTPLMGIRAMEHDENFEEPRCSHNWVPLDSISPYMAIAVIASEDQDFTQHSGFDWDAIEQARKEAEQGKRRRGASTISQQTAKNAFLWPNSTWTRKGFEAYFTVLIEFMWGKERIMEVYLNSIEMGDGIYGVDAVAQEHFGRRAWTLTREQCALIAATLPNPRKYSSKHPSSYMRKRQKQILKQMKNVEHYWRELREGDS
ncbi:MAG: monofunctional biosynthetic peptidoglycan transglycosylase [Bacteroidales bacterium]|nr:monofunctional biosynthetic peptidoglycan transglycosylase [Bacteroidales bacterium]